MLIQIFENKELTLIKVNIMKITLGKIRAKQKLILAKSLTANCFHSTIQFNSIQCFSRLSAITKLNISYEI